MIYNAHVPTSVKNGVISSFRKGSIAQNFAIAKFRKNKTIANVSEFTVCFAHLMLNTVYCHFSVLS